VADTITSSTPSTPSPHSSDRPTLIAENVHINYKTYGVRRRPEGTKAPGWARGLAQIGAVDVVRAVRGVSFVANHGESIALIGHNGSGKSTLMKAMAGLVPCSEGAVYTDGTASLLGVGGALNKALTGERNVNIGLLALGLTPRQVREATPQIIEFADIGSFMQLPMTAYSSGMQARLRFAISTAVAPDILLIDEALATGDKAFRKRSQDKIDEIRSQAGTVFLVSHSMSTVLENCDRGLWLHRGQLRMDGPVEEVVEAYESSMG
jgi:teichoic acid transport system ATP-binding protein